MKEVEQRVAALESEIAQHEAALGISRARKKRCG